MKGPRFNPYQASVSFDDVPLPLTRPRHSDDRHVKAFAAAMAEKLAWKRDEGRGGWEDRETCTAEHLSALLRQHVEKGDPVDVANFCMMLHQRGERIAALASQAEDACLSSDEKHAQAMRCACKGTDDYCVCQNVPDRQTLADRTKKGAPAPASTCATSDGDQTE